MHVSLIFKDATFHRFEQTLIHEKSLNQINCYHVLYFEKDFISNPGLLIYEIHKNWSYMKDENTTVWHFYKWYSDCIFFFQKRLHI